MRVCDSMLLGRYWSLPAKPAVKCLSLCAAKWMFVQGEVLVPMIYALGLSHQHDFRLLHDDRFTQ